MSGVRWQGPRDNAYDGVVGIRLTVGSIGLVIGFMIGRRRAGAETRGLTRGGLRARGEP